MPIFTAALGSVSGGLAVLSHLLTSDNAVSQSHQSLLPASTASSLSSSSFPSRSFSAIRASLLVPKVSLSTGNTKPDAAMEQSMSSDDVRLDRRSADWKAARAYHERGLIYEGRVEGFNAGGLLIRFYSLVGFLPFPQLSPSHSCKEPNKTIQEIARDLTGSIISMKVIQADEEKRKLIFSEKKASWAKFSKLINLGDIYEARVGLVEDFGAFLHLRLPDGNYHLTGLLHISEMSWDIVRDARDVLTEGEEVRVKVINIDRVKSRVTLSLRQLEEDPLLETLHKAIPQDTLPDSDSWNRSNITSIQPLPGLETIINELQQEDGIKGVKISRQGFEKRAVSQDLQLWLSNAPPTRNQFTLLARAGRQVQEIQLTTSLDQDGIKKALQRVLERVP